jgi:plastocyanin
MVVRRVHERAALALMLVVAVAAATVVAGASAAAKTRTVKATDSVYTPRKLTVRSGTTVVWDFNGSLPHNVEVTSGPELFSSSIVKRGTFTHKLRKRGTYKIVCSLHQNMTMKVIVK